MSKCWSHQEHIQCMLKEISKIFAFYTHTVYTILYAYLWNIHSMTIWHRMTSVYQFSNNSFSFGFGTTRDKSKFFSRENPARKSKNQIRGIFGRWDPAFPKNKDPYVFCRSAMGRPKSSDILWVDDALMWHLLEGFYALKGYPLHFRLWNVQIFQNFKMNPLPRSFLKHQLVNISLMLFETLSWLRWFSTWKFLPGLSFQHRLAHLADERRS